MISYPQTLQPLLIHCQQWHMAHKFILEIQRKIIKIFIPFCAAMCVRCTRDEIEIYARWTISIQQIERTQCDKCGQSHVLNYFIFLNLISLTPVVIFQWAMKSFWFLLEFKGNFGVWVYWLYLTFVRRLKWVIYD